MLENVMCSKQQWKMCLNQISLPWRQIDFFFFQSNSVTKVRLLLLRQKSLEINTTNSNRQTGS